MTQEIDAVVAGHICLDITPQFRSDPRPLTEILRPGSLVNVGPATLSTGGSAPNTGFPLRRLGMNVALMGKIGLDAMGRAILEIIRAEAPGAEEGMKTVAGQNTSYSVVLAPPGHDRTFLHCTGANDTFGTEDVDFGLVGRARLMHFGYPPLMARTYADGGRELVEIFQKARTAGATTSLDMAYPDPASPAGKVDWAGLLRRALPHVDVFTPGAEELLFMLRRGRHDELAAAGGVLDGIDGTLLSDLGGLCIEAGAGVVMIKCGRQGLYLRTAGRGRLERLGRGKPDDLSSWINRELFEPSYQVERVVSATGAGDCATAGFLAAMLRNCPAADAVRTACAAGAQNVTAADAVSGVRSWPETAEQVRARPPKAKTDILLPRFRYDAAQEHFVGPRDGAA